MPLKTFLVNS